MTKQRYKRRSKVPVPPEPIPLLPVLTGLINTLDQEHRHRRWDIRLRIPRDLKWRLIDELAPSYRNSLFGDLADVFRFYAAEHWGLTYANVPIVLDRSLQDVLVVDTLEPPTRMRAKPPTQQLQKA